MKGSTVTDQRKPGDLFLAHVAHVKPCRPTRVSAPPDRVVWRSVHATAFELWDRAPVRARVPGYPIADKQTAPSGYCDPWWARLTYGDTDWWLVSFPEKGTEPGPVAVLVTGAVRANLHALTDPSFTVRERRRILSESVV